MYRAGSRGSVGCPAGPLFPKDGSLTEHGARLAVWTTLLQYWGHRHQHNQTQPFTCVLGFELRSSCLYSKLLPIKPSLYMHRPPQECILIPIGGLRDRTNELMSVIKAPTGTGKRRQELRTLIVIVWWPVFLGLWCEARDLTSLSLHFPCCQVG